jgi:hypothetical protein
MISFIKTLIADVQIRRWPRSAAELPRKHSVNVANAASIVVKAGL